VILIHSGRSPDAGRGRHSPDKNRGRTGSGVVSGTRDFEVFNLSGGWRKVYYTNSFGP
jgi:hypothetical protein